MLTAVLAAACGGGGGGGGNEPSAAPTPRPSPVLPITPPGPPSSTAEIILRNGDRLGDDLVIDNIEDAALGNGTASALVTVADTAQLGAIVQRATDGTMTLLFDPRQAEDVDASSLSRLRMGPTGEVVFQSGRGLDTDRLHLIADGVLTTLAGAPPGPVFPDFRILGNVRIGPDGVVAFVGGGDACEVVVGDEQPRITCTNALYVASPADVVRLDAEALELELARQRPTAIRVEIDPLGASWFSLPRRGEAPMLLRHTAGKTSVVMSGEDELPGIGLLNVVEAVAVNLAGDVLVEATLRAFEGERRPQVVGVLRGDTFTLLAKEGSRLGGQNVASLRGIAIDGAGRALFEANLGPSDDTPAQRGSLWYGGSADELVEIVREGAPFPGEPTTVVDLQGSRLNDAGDVAFTTRLGVVGDETSRVDEIRATVRRADGRLVTIASSRNTGQLGALSSLQIVGFDQQGSLLLIGARTASSDRVLLLGRSDGGAD